MAQHVEHHPSLQQLTSAGGCFTWDVQVQAADVFRPRVANGAAQAIHLKRNADAPPVNFHLHRGSRFISEDQAIHAKWERDFYYFFGRPPVAAQGALSSTGANIVPVHSAGRQRGKHRPPMDSTAYGHFRSNAATTPPCTAVEGGATAHHTSTNFWNPPCVHQPDAQPPAEWVVRGAGGSGSTTATAHDSAMLKLPSLFDAPVPSAMRPQGREVRRIAATDATQLFQYPLLCVDFREVLERKLQSVRQDQQLPSKARQLFDEKFGDLLLQSGARHAKVVDDDVQRPPDMGLSAAQLLATIREQTKERIRKEQQQLDLQRKARLANIGVPKEATIVGGGRYEV